MPSPDELLAAISGGRILDAATGGGRFIAYVAARLKDYSEVVGVDIDEGASERFAERFSSDPRVAFITMDARRLEFPARSFDTASIGHALCEFDDPLRVLSDLVHVVRLGGHVIVAESYRDQASEPTMNHVRLHDWWVAVDRLSGSSHSEYRPRSVLVRDLESLGLSELRLLDVPNEETGPKDDRLLAELDELADRYLALADGQEALQARGIDLMERVHQYGFQPATALLAVGRVYWRAAKS